MMYKLYIYVHIICQIIHTTTIPRSSKHLTFYVESDGVFFSPAARLVALPRFSRSLGSLAHAPGTLPRSTATTTT